VKPANADVKPVSADVKPVNADLKHERGAPEPQRSVFMINKPGNVHQTPPHAIRILALYDSVKITLNPNETNFAPFEEFCITLGRALEKNKRIRLTFDVIDL